MNSTCAPDRIQFSGRPALGLVPRLDEYIGSPAEFYSALTILLQFQRHGGWRDDECEVSIAKNWAHLVKVLLFNKLHPEESLMDAIKPFDFG